MKAPKQKYQYIKKPYLTEKIIKELIVPNIALLTNKIGISLYKDTVKKQYSIGVYAIDSFNWAFEARELQLTPVDDELPEWS